MPHDGRYLFQPGKGRPSQTVGNALWEVASTIGIAIENDATPKFPADWDYRPFFSLPDEFFGDCRGGTEATELVTDLSPTALPYLQNLSLFIEHAAEIRWYLRPSELAQTILNKQIGFRVLEGPVLSVHVRRGDNVPGADPGVVDKWRFHPLPPDDYYAKGIEMWEGDYNSIAVFSDDPNWCRRHIPADYYHDGMVRSKEHEPTYKAEPVMDWVDLFMMSRCAGHVLAASTFGWWGAWLAGDDRAVVPDPWFGPALSSEIDAGLMIPAGWRYLHREVRP